MNFIDNINKDFRKGQKDTSKSFRKDEKSKTKSHRKNQKDIQKQFQKIMKLAVRKEIIQEKRKSLTNKRKDEVYAKYKAKCDACNRKNALEIHHKNFKNTDDSLPNLRLLCSLHHTLEHEKRYKSTFAKKYHNKKK